MTTFAWPVVAAWLPLGGIRTRIASASVTILAAAKWRDAISRLPTRFISCKLLRQRVSSDTERIPTVRTPVTPTGVVDVTLDLSVVHVWGPISREIDESRTPGPTWPTRSRALWSPVSPTWR